MARRNKIVSAAAGRSDIPAIESVLIDKRVLAGYRKRAKTAYPNEFLEAIFGQITVDGVAQVHAFYHFDHTSTRNSCEYNPVEYLELESIAQERGLHMLGTIHSHPGYDTCSHPSDLDHTTGKQFGEKLMGILHIWKKGKNTNSKLSFNVPATPVKIELTSV